MVDLNGQCQLFKHLVEESEALLFAGTVVCTQSCEKQTTSVNQRVELLHVHGSRSACNNSFNIRRTPPTMPPTKLAKSRSRADCMSVCCGTFCHPGTFCHQRIILDAMEVHFGLIQLGRAADHAYCHSYPGVNQVRELRHLQFWSSN